MNEISTIGAFALVPHSMDEAMKLAEFMARARTVPKHLQDSPGDCLMVVELAMRWGMSPFAVAQGTGVISGKLMIEGKLVAAAVESSGAIVGQFDYEFTGEGDGRAITATATRRGETAPRSVTVALKDARTNNEMWKRQPDQQLVYHSVRVWARRWTPAVILGVYSREEFMGTTIDGEVIAADERAAINDSVPLKAAATRTPHAERIVDPTLYDTPEPEQPRRRTAADVLAALEISLRDCKNRVEVDRVLFGEEAMKFAGWAKNGNLARFNALKAAALERHEPELPDDMQKPADDEVDDLAIVGEEKLLAGD